MSTHVLSISSKGQIVLPIAIRKALSINNGDKLVAYVSKDTILLKPLKLPTDEELEEAIRLARK